MEVLVLALLLPIACPGEGDYRTDFRGDRRADFHTFVQVGTRGLRAGNGHGRYGWDGALTLEGRYGTEVGVALLRGGPADDGVFGDVCVTADCHWLAGDPATAVFGLGLRQAKSEGYNTYPLYHVLVEEGRLEIRSWSGYDQVQVLASADISWRDPTAPWRLVASVRNRERSTRVDLDAALYEDGVERARLHAEEGQIAAAGFVSLHGGEGPGNSAAWRGVAVDALLAADPVFRREGFARGAADFATPARLGGYGEAGPAAGVLWLAELVLGGRSGRGAAVELLRGGPLDDGLFPALEATADLALAGPAGAATLRLGWQPPGGSEALEAALEARELRLARWLPDPATGAPARSVLAATPVPDPGGRLRLVFRVGAAGAAGGRTVHADLQRDGATVASLRWQGADLPALGRLLVAGGSADPADPTPAGAALDRLEVREASPPPETAGLTAWIEDERTLTLRFLEPSDGSAPVDVSACVFQDPASYTIESAGDPAYRTPRPPDAVGRHSEEADAHPWVGGIPWAADLAHFAHLRLPAPLLEGATYTVRVRRVVAGEASVDVSWSETATRNRNVKVNQVGWFTHGPKTAFVGGWLGDLGPLPAADLQGRPFRVRDAATGAVVFTGTLVLRKRAGEPDDLNRNFSGEDLFAADFSGLDRPGRYFVSVPGLGRSAEFAIRDAPYHELARTAARALYHERHGFALDPRFTAWPRGAAHRGPTRPTSVNNRDCDDCFAELKDTANWQQGWLQTHEGGWWDAGDWDSRWQHFEVAWLLADLQELRPAAFPDGALGIPESGNGVPDLLDEADFGLKLYLGMQQEDLAAGRGAGIRGGVNTDRNAPWILPETYDGPWYAYAQDETSSLLYARAAARLGRVLQPHAPARAATWLDSARQAWDWATGRFAQARDQRHLARAAAALELWSATGDPAFHQEFLDHWPLREDSWTPLCKGTAWAYATLPGGGQDPALLQDVRDRLSGWAQDAAGRAARQGYRNARSRGYALLWHETGTSLWPAADLLRGWLLDPARADWRDAALAQVDYQLGVNPLAMCWITGVGERSPRRPLHLQSWADGIADPVPGLSIFGHAQGTFGNSLAVQDAFWPPKDVYPPFRMFTDSNEGAVQHAEFTIHENLGWNVWVYGLLRDGL